MEMGDRDETVKKIMTEHFQKLEDAFLNALTHGNETSDSDLANHARYLVCMAQGLNVIAKTAPDRQKLNGIVDAALSPFLATAVAGASAEDRRFKASLVS
jgi:TetR/AcrR family transcriptional repressor of nem operon